MHIYILLYTIISMSQAASLPRMSQVYIYIHTYIYIYIYTIILYTYIYIYNHIKSRPPLRSDQPLHGRRVPCSGATGKAAWHLPVLRKRQRAAWAALVGWAREMYDLLVHTYLLNVNPGFINLYTL